MPRADSATKRKLHQGVVTRAAAGSHGRAATERGARRLELRLPGVDRSAVAGEALEAGSLGAPQGVGIEIREPSAGVVSQTEQRVSIQLEPRLPYQLPRDGLRLPICRG